MIETRAIDRFQSDEGGGRAERLFKFSKSSSSRVSLSTGKPIDIDRVELAHISFQRLQATLFSSFQGRYWPGSRLAHPNHVSTLETTLSHRAVCLNLIETNCSILPGLRELLKYWDRKEAHRHPLQLQRYIGASDRSRRYRKRPSLQLSNLKISAEA